MPDRADSKANGLRPSRRQERRLNTTATGPQAAKRKMADTHMDGSSELNTRISFGVPAKASIVPSGDSDHSRTWYGNSSAISQRGLGEYALAVSLGCPLPSAFTA